MTKIEAIEYGVACYKNRVVGEDTPSVLMEKDGEFLAGLWSEYDYAKSCGWKYAGSIPDEARALGLI
ncbi:MAG: hypothetical protein LUG17_03285 [Clostridiales bacterium]|nr:hypothetical protein [Clostridiales bacterium]